MTSHTARASSRASVLALHHGYRVAGGEERAAAQLANLATSHLGERIEWLLRDSTQLSSADAARGLLAGGTGAQDVTAAIQESGADLVHAHNLFPTFGPVALRAAREAGAAVVVHLHNYRLACAVAVAVRRGHDCTQCGRNWTAPGVMHRCRGTLAESVAYAAALPRWQKAVIEEADVIIVPSVAARLRLEQFGVRLPPESVHVVGGVAEGVAPRSTASTGRYALLVTRLAAEKDVRTAIDACRLAGLPLVIAGDGPERDALEAHAGPAPYAGGPLDPSLTRVRTLLGPETLADLDTPPVLRGTTIFAGRASDAALASLRAGASVGLATSVAHETFGLSALESMSAALPTVGSRVGALPELIGEELTVTPGDAAGLAELIRRVAGDDEAGTAAAARAQQLAGADIVAEKLGGAYAAARDRLAVRLSYG